jgi:hypothetical protein
MRHGDNDDDFLSGVVSRFLTRRTTTQAFAKSLPKPADCDCGRWENDGKKHACR